MFDLDQAIAAWRRQMAADGIKTPAVLKELEGHLRDDIDEQLRSGIDPEEAFAAAVQRLGKADSLKHEFAKAGRILVWQPANLKLAVLMGVVLVTFMGLSGFGMPAAAGLMGTISLAALILLGWRYASGGGGAWPRICPLTPDTTRALELARQAASRYHHDFVGTEHLLLALLETGVVCDVLQRLGVKREAIRTEVENLVAPGSEQSIVSTLPCTPRVRRALRLASKEAKAMRHSHVRPESLFLGLLLEGNGVAALALKNLSLDAHRTRAEILKANQNGA